MCITNNIIQRTFRIRCGDSVGTCFTVDIDKRFYLVTARHIACHIRDRDKVEIFHDNEWKSLGVRLVGHSSGQVDISILAPQKSFGELHPLSVDTGSLTLAEDVYFLGFPFDLKVDGKELNSDFPFPLIKKATVSAIYLKGEFILLDGHNNPGFSGGPVVRRFTPDKKQIVIGVVSGYLPEENYVLDDEGRKGPYTYSTNAGIIFACSAKHIKQLVSDNPVGIEID